MNMLRPSDVKRIYQELIGALPGPVYKSEHGVAQEIGDYYRVIIGQASPSQLFQTMDQSEVALTATFFVDFATRAHHDDLGEKIIDAQELIIQSVLDIDQPELSFESFQLPNIDEASASVVLLRSQWDLEYCISINPSYD